MKHINENGRSMVEMLGVLAIIGVLSVGGIAGYSKAMNKYKINKTNDQVSMLVANIRTLFSSQNDYEGLDNAQAIKFGVVPNDMYKSNATGASANKITNAFGGEVTIGTSPTDAGHATSAFTVEYKNIPEEACVNIMTADWGSGQGSGLIAIAVTSGTGSNVAGADLSTVYVGNAGKAAAQNSTEVIATPGGTTQSAPLTVSQAVDACGTSNTITWKYY